jgi:hypothetical protein
MSAVFVDCKPKVNLALAAGAMSGHGPSSETRIRRPRPERTERAIRTMTPWWSRNSIRISSTSCVGPLNRTTPSDQPDASSAWTGATSIAAVRRPPSPLSANLGEQPPNDRRRDGGVVDLEDELDHRSDRVARLEPTQLSLNR